jgi:nitrous oxidase accessory protein NosD
MEGSLVEGTFLSRVKGAPEFGAGVWVQEGATAYVTGCRIEGNEVLGVVARDPDTELFLDGNRISDTVSRRDGLFGQGVTILDEAWARIDDNTLVGNRDTGVLIARTGRAIANRNVIEDTLNEAGSDRFGRGISVLLDGSLVLNGNLLRNNRDASITVSSGGLLEGSGNRILDTMPGESGWFGHGIAADQGAEITLAGTLVQASRGAGLSVLGSTLDMKGSVVSSTVSGTAPDPSGIGSVSLAGDGLLAISFGGDRNGLDIRDSWFLGNTGAGMRLYESDGSVLDTVSSANDFGLVYMQANGLDAEDSNRFEGNREQDVVIVDSTAAAAMSFAPSPQSSIPEGW